MPTPPTSNPEQIIQGTPILHVEDLKKTARYYRDILGFTWDFDTEDYCVVWRDNSAIHFTQGRGNPSGVHLFQWVKDVNAIYDEVRNNGGEVTVEIDDRPYGIRDFSVIDPNGVVIVFGQDIQ